jgi:hypothetical protein
VHVTIWTPLLEAYGRRLIYKKAVIDLGKFRNEAILKDPQEENLGGCVDLWTEPEGVTELSF